MQKAPALKSNELLDRINSIIESDALDELELKRLELEARSLISSNINEIKSSGYEILGTLAAIKLDHAKVLEYFNAATMLANSEQLLTRSENMVAALQNTYQFRDALKRSIELSDNNPDNLDVLYAALSTATLSLNTKSITALNHHAFLLGQPKDNYSVANIEAMIQLMDKLQVDDEDLLQRLEVISEVMMSMKFRFKSIFFSILDTGEASYKFVVPTTAETAASISFQIADALVDKFEDTLSDVITFSCIPSK